MGTALSYLIVAAPCSWTSICTRSPYDSRPSLGWWKVLRCLRESHMPSAVIQRRRVSRPTWIACPSARASVASVGPKIGVGGHD